MNDDQTKGKLNQAAGTLTGDDSQKNKGKIQEGLGDIKEAAGKLKDAVTDKLDDHKRNDSTTTADHR